MWMVRGSVGAFCCCMYKFILVRVALPAMLSVRPILMYHFKFKVGRSYGFPVFGFVANSLFVAIVPS